MSGDYEIVYIVDEQIKDVTVVQKKIDALLDISLVKHQSLGVKRFAYPIKKKLSGHYFLIKVKQEGEKIKNFVNEVRWVPEILRFLVVNLAKEKHFRFSQAQKKHQEKKNLWNKRKLESSLIATPDSVSSVSVGDKLHSTRKGITKNGTKSNE